MHCVPSTHTTCLETVKLKVPTIPFGFVYVVTRAIMRVITHVVTLWQLIHAMTIFFFFLQCATFVSEKVGNLGGKNFQQ